MTEAPVAVPDSKKKKDEGPVVFGLYQQETGSLTLGDYRFRPLQPLKVPADVEDLACEETSPVKFFPTLAATNDAAAKLKAKFELRRKPKEREE
ncbi:MAG TPA: hypothetical protein VHY84_14945 [Bryobacteraceae bacterium]|jgi:hypothetical protein|nr:hypothetical protein [Bryobacteraceae bacterium]